MLRESRDIDMLHKQPATRKLAKSVKIGDGAKIILQNTLIT